MDLRIEQGSVPEEYVIVPRSGDGILFSGTEKTCRHALEKMRRVERELIRELARETENADEQGEGRFQAGCLIDIARRLGINVEEKT